jgi:hypothetical protein
MAVLPAIPAEVGELSEPEKALVLRATASPAIPWRPTRRTASGDLVLEATISAGQKYPDMVRDLTLTRTPAGLVNGSSAPRPA